MDIRPPFVTNHEPPEMLEPRECSLDNPTMLAELLRCLDPTSRDPGEHASDPAGHPAAAKVIGLVCVQLQKAPSGASSTMPDARNRIEQLLERDRVMLVRRPHKHGHRDAVGISDQVVLGSVLAPVRRVRADRLAPLFALMLEASKAPRSQSIRPASFSSSSRIRWRPSQTPWSCHSWRRRQHVIPLPQPISCGKSAHRMPVFKTNRMPRKAFWFGTGGRPPFGFGVGGGRSGAMRSQSSEGKISRAIQVHYAFFPQGTRGFVTTSKSVPRCFRWVTG